MEEVEGVKKRSKGEESRFGKRYGSFLTCCVWQETHAFKI